MTALPDTVRRVAVLDRTKEPGSLGEPPFLDALGALAEAHAAGALRSMPVVTGGRYGLSSKEFTPGMVAGIFTGLAAARAPGDAGQRAINLAPREPLVEQARRDIAFFERLPGSDWSRVDFGTVRGTQFLQPLFEFSGACVGCGETPYLKLLSQLFGDRLMIANATGCSSIYGGNLPTTPWAANAEGCGPAWSNSLFEDNAEFGLGFRLAADLHLRLARSRLTQLREQIGPELVDEILASPQRRESEVQQRGATYEEKATRGAARFPADGRPAVGSASG